MIRRESFLFRSRVHVLYIGIYIYILCSRDECRDIPTRAFILHRVVYTLECNMCTSVVRVCICEPAGVARGNKNVS